MHPLLLLAVLQPRCGWHLSARGTCWWHQHTPVCILRGAACGLSMRVWCLCWCSPEGSARPVAFPIHHNLVAGSQSPGKVNIQETKHLTTQKLPFLKQLENNFFFFLRAVWWCFSGAGVGVGVFNIFPSDKVAHGHPGQCPGDTKLCAPGGQRCSIQEKDLDRLERWSCEKLMTPNKAK